MSFRREQVQSIVGRSKNIPNEPLRKIVGMIRSKGVTVAIFLIANCIGICYT